MSTVVSAAPPWGVLVGSDARTVTVPRSLSGRRAVVRQLRSLPVAAPVVLVGSGAVNRSRLRRTAAAAGVEIEHEYVVLPGIADGRYVVEDDPATVTVLWQNLAGPPPGTTRSTALIGALAALGRSRLPWWALGTVAPRMAIGRRGGA